MKAEVTITGKVFRLSPIATPSVVCELMDMNAAFFADLTRLRLGQDTLEAMGHTMDRIRLLMTRILLLSIRELQPDYSGDEIARLSSAELCSACRRILLLGDKPETRDTAASNAVH